MWAQLKEAMRGDKVKKRTISVQLLREEYAVMQANLTVTDENRSLVVESLRSIAETVIWGDQNDPQVFDFFLEKVTLCLPPGHLPGSCHRQARLVVCPPHTCPYNLCTFVRRIPAVAPHRSTCA